MIQYYDGTVSILIRMYLKSKIALFIQCVEAMLVKSDIWY